MVKFDSNFRIAINIPNMANDIVLTNGKCDKDFLYIPTIYSDILDEYLYMKININDIIYNDIENFKKLNLRSDKNHQVNINSLTLYKVNISGNYIHLYYWFDQYKDNSCHRTCSGNITRFDYLADNKKLFPEVYSSDCTVYW